MKKAILISAIAILSLTSCATLITIDAAANKLVTVYCSAPTEARKINRALVGAVVSPNKIEIVCYADSSR